MNNNFNFKKLYRKPIFPIMDYLNFNCIGYKVDNHPIIIMEYNDDIVFLTAQSATYKDGKLKIENDNFLKNKFNKNQLYLLEKTNELNIKQKGLFQKLSMVDTTSLFVMNKQDFCKCYNINNKNLYATRKINLFDWSNLIKQVKDNIKNNNIVINRVFVKEFQNTLADTYTKIIYANKEIVNNELEHLKPIVKEKDFNNLLNNINEYYNDDQIKDNLLTLFDNKFNEAIFLLYEEKNSIYPESDEYEIIGSNTNYDICVENMFDISVEKATEIDFETKLETESFSDYEKDYYKQHPEEYQAKYKTYLETLKEAYYEYKTKTSKKSVKI